MKNYLIYCLALAMTGCGQKLRFDESPESKALRCVPGTTAVTKPTKFLFLVDQSGSNLNGPFEHPGMATDAAKSFRYGAINEFFGKYSNNQTMKWGFVSFQGSLAVSRIGGGFSDKTAMSSALSAFLSSTDVDATPYRAALRAARDMIQADIIASGSVQYLYRIAFLTDGYPTDYCNDPMNTYCPSEVNDSAVVADINALTALSPDIQLSTVYYGLPDLSATARLANMASVGKGQFVDASVLRDIHLDNVIEVPKVCPVEP